MRSLRRALGAALALLLALSTPLVAAGQWSGGNYRTWSGFLLYAPWIWPSRDYRLYLPDGLDPGIARPLLVLLHGCKQDPEGFAAGSRMNALADREGFLVLYPRQDAASNIERCWNWFDGFTQNRLGEAAIIMGMVDEVAKRYPVDQHRIYVAGLSAGGAMAAILASCYADVFAAAAIHSGVAYKAATAPWNALAALEAGSRTAPEAAGRDAWKCSNSTQRPMPVIVFQGDADERVRPINADQVVRQFAQMGDLADDGQDNDSVKAAPTATTREQQPGGHAYTVREYRYGGTMLLLEYRIQGMAHAWSGGDEAQPYNDAAGPDATELMWRFFTQHSR